jgi:hypothetical protein
MPLLVKDGMGAWIKDFKNSNAPQFKGKSEKERRDMAIAAYMSAKRGAKDEGYVSTAQRKAVWANRADGGKGHPDNKKEAAEKPPFAGGQKRQDTVTDKSGAKHTPMSRARDLARKARDMQKLEKDLKRAGVKFVATESVEYIEEANTYINAGRALADYGRKQGGSDKVAFDKASKFMYQIGKADILSKGQHLAAFSKFFRDLDRDVRVGIVQILKKQNVLESVEYIEEADNFDKNFTKRIGAKARGGKGAEYLSRKAKEYQDANPDKGKGIGPAVLDIPKARKKAAERGIRPGSLRASPNTRDPKRLPESLEEMTFKVSIEGLPVMYMTGTSPGNIKQQLRKIVKQPSMIDAVQRVTDTDVKKAFRLKAQGKDIEEAKSPNPEDNQPASPDEKSMAMKQAEFIGYVAKEIQDHMKKNKEFPEWMQNKLSAFHQKSKDMHSTLGAHGPDEKDDD